MPVAQFGHDILEKGILGTRRLGEITLGKVSLGKTL